MATLFEMPARVPKVKEAKPRSQRDIAVQEFVDTINQERIGTKFKKIATKIVAIKLGHLDTQELFYFLSVCKDYKKRNGSFSKGFFGMLKVKKDEDTKE